MKVNRDFGAHASNRSSDRPRRNWPNKYIQPLREKVNELSIMFARSFASMSPEGVLRLASDVGGRTGMKIKVVVHDADEGGFWAEVPAIPGCATQGETMEELLRNLHEAIEGSLSVDVAEPKSGGRQCILEITV
jgi:predicted RNase H-like HicB family nuclease